MTSDDTPPVAPRHAEDQAVIDALLDELYVAHLALAAEQSEHEQTRVKLRQARATVDREYNQHRTDLEQLHARIRRHLSGRRAGLVDLDQLRLRILGTP